MAPCASGGVNIVQNRRFENRDASADEKEAAGDREDRRRRG